MALPCEVAVKNVSVIKAKLARALKKAGFPQKEIARQLGITDAAVSQYLSGKRAKKQKTSKPERVEQVCKICGVCR